MFTCILIPPAAITERVACRSLKPYGVELLKGRSNGSVSATIPPTRDAAGGVHLPLY